MGRKAARLTQTCTASASPRSRRSLTIFDLLLFVGAAAITYPLAKMLSGHVAGPWRTEVFYSFMVVVYPILGFSFIVVFWHVAGFCRRHRDDPHDHHNPNAV